MAMLEQREATPITHHYADGAPPRLSGGLPLIGHTLEFARDTVGLLFRAQRECGEVAEFKAAHRRMVLMSGPAAAEAVFTAPDEVMSQREVYKIMTPVFGQDVAYDATPERMREQLGLLMPALRHIRLQSYVEVVADEVLKYIGDWGEEGEIDLLDFGKELTNYTSSACLLGPEFRQEMSSEFSHVYHDLEQGITPVAYINPYLPLPAFRKRDRARVRLVQLIGDVMARRRSRGGDKGYDFLQTLMDAQYQDGTRLSEHEVTGILLAVMFAGHHTSSVTTAWTLLELLQHPSYLARVEAELQQVYDGDPLDQMTFAHLRRVEQLERGIKESLRLHPPLFMLLRYAAQDFHYGGYRIPRGTFVIVAPQVCNRLPEVFRDPNRFDPDRFGPGREEDQRPFAFLTFGGGRHKCMGHPFAFLQIKTIFSILLRSFDFELTSDPIQPNFKGLVVGPEQPCRVRYRRRRDAPPARSPRAAEAAE
jgi:sterol 14-demethylase